LFSGGALIAHKARKLRITAFDNLILMSAKNITLVLCLFSASYFHAYSQSLYIIPSAGGQSLLCSFDKKIGKINTLKVNYLNLAIDYSVLMNYSINNRFSVSTGFSHSEIGWSFKMTIPKNLQKNPDVQSD
jgi:hypothetical protein